jgi:hypothetical protein
MREVEAYARRRDCDGVFLDTFEYQALAFYEKLGYEQFGTLEGCPPVIGSCICGSAFGPDDRTAARSCSALSKRVVKVRPSRHQRPPPLAGEFRMQRRTRYAVAAALAAAVWLGGATAEAQSTVNKEKVKVIATNDAVAAARYALVKHGYEIVRVDVIRDTRIIYYRVGNRGRGRGKGRLEKIVIRRDRERVVFDDAPKVVQLEINVKLGI